MRWLTFGAWFALTACASGAANNAADGPPLSDGRGPADTMVGGDSLPPDGGPDASSDALAPDASVDAMMPPARHLMLSEIVVMPTSAEYVEIFNPNPTAVDLTNYYVSDRTDYYLIVTGSIDVSLARASDFVARFPAGAIIGPSQYQTISLHMASDFNTVYGLTPTYELVSSSPAVPDMVAALPNSIGGSASLTDNGEPVILFYWDQSSDLVRDVDYLLYGVNTGTDGAIDKTGVSVDGPDPGTTGTLFAADTPAAMQVQLPKHNLNGSLVRCDFAETGERMTGGNGISGHDETSEPFPTTWRINLATAALRTPGAGPAPGFCP